MGEENKPLNIVDEARAIKEEILKAKEELKAEREALQKAQAESLLSSSAGQPQPIQPPKEDTPKEYAEKVLKGEIKAK